MCVRAEDVMAFSLLFRGSVVRPRSTLENGMPPTQEEIPDLKGGKVPPLKIENDQSVTIITRREKKKEVTLPPPPQQVI